MKIFDSNIQNYSIMNCVNKEKGMTIIRQLDSRDGHIQFHWHNLIDELVWIEVAE